LANKETLTVWAGALQNRWWGPGAFLAIYALACLAALPATPFTLAGGVVFGVWKGTVLNVTGATLGAALAFLAARVLGREAVASLLKGKFKTLEGLDQKAQKSGFQIILNLRLLPVVPFNALNFGAGLTRIRFRDFLAGTALGIIPGAFVYTYSADAIASGVAGEGKKAFYRILIAGALLALLSAAPKLLSRLQKK
jgi:uncharacterized membrane protein YdjX (TVP38/TMEM64 family)